jgi:ABC-type Fe3+/spermidine/putrescine transport system ATPase subunit
MKDGQLINQGPPEKIYNEQQDEYTAGLFGRYNVLKGDELALFGLFEGGHKNNLIVRPERFELSKEKTERAQAGKVKQVYFFWRS